SFFLLRWWRLRGPRRELEAVAAGGRPGSALSVLHDLEQALSVRAEERTLAAHGIVAELLGPAWRAGFPDWAQVEAWLAWVRDVRRVLVQIVPGAEAPDTRLLHAVANLLDCLANGSKTLPQQLAALQHANDELTAASGAVSSLLDLDAELAFG